MEIPVLVEPVAGNGYRATSRSLLDLSAEGPTPEEAVGRLRGLLQERMAAGSRVVSMRVSPTELPAAEHPWARFAGDLKDDPLLEEWKQAMAEYRQQVENDP